MTRLAFCLSSVYLFSLLGLSGQVSYEKIFATYIGGSGYEVNGGVEIDQNGDIWICGSTTSADFPLLDNFQDYIGGNFPGSDGFVSKLSPDGELLYSTYIGGSGEELVTAIAIDKRGAIVIAGATTSADFPLVNALQQYKGGALYGSDAFVLVISPDGSGIEFSTLFGGSSEETVNGVAVDSQNNIYLAGTTTSFDYETSGNAFQPEFSRRGVAGTDIFVVKLAYDEGSGTHAMVYNTLLGGSLDEHGADIAVDAAGRCFLTGYTNSPDFPLRDPVQSDPRSEPPEYEAFVAAFEPDGQALYFSSYFGGSQRDNGTQLHVTSDGTVTILGSTESNDLEITQDPLQQSQGGASDLLFARFAGGGSAWENVYGTYIGGPGRDIGTSVHGMGDNAVIVGGVTVDGSMADAYAIDADESGAKGDAFFLEWTPAEDSLIYTHVIGGSDDESMVEIAGSKGIAVITGATRSSDFPVVNAFQTTYANAGSLLPIPDLFVVGLSRETTTGIANMAPGDMRFAVFPNPVHSKITIELQNPAGLPLRLVLFNMLGEKVMHILATSHHSGALHLERPVVHLPDGAYVCCLFTDAGAYQRRIVIHHQ